MDPFACCEDDEEDSLVLGLPAETLDEITDMGGGGGISVTCEESLCGRIEEIMLAWSSSMILLAAGVNEPPAPPPLSMDSRSKYICVSMMTFLKL